MVQAGPWDMLALGALFETLLPDLLLGFVFFTALSFAVLGRRFDRKRPAVALSTAIGAALSIALVWWEYDHRLSIRNLGPLSIGLVLLVLGIVMYQATARIGGIWAGGCLAIGMSLMVGTLFGLGWPVQQQIVHTVILVTLTSGAIAFLLHHHHAPPDSKPVTRSAWIPPTSHVPEGGVWKAPNPSAPKTPWAPEVGVPGAGAGAGVPGGAGNVYDIDDDHRIAMCIADALDQAQVRSRRLNTCPAEAEAIKSRLVRVIPLQGKLTERLAILRETARHAREGQLARINTLQARMKALSPAQRNAAADEIANRYHQLQFDIRLQRLDGAVAEAERRTRDLTERAERALAAGDYAAVSQLLAAASKLQHQCAKLIETIERTEHKLLAEARRLVCCEEAAVT